MTDPGEAVVEIACAAAWEVVEAELKPQYRMKWADLAEDGPAKRDMRAQIRTALAAYEAARPRAQGEAGEIAKRLRKLGEDLVAGREVDGAGNPCGPAANKLESQSQRIAALTHERDEALAKLERAKDSISRFDADGARKALTPERAP